MNTPIQKSDKYKDYSIRIDREKETLSLFDKKKEFVSSVSLSDLADILIEWNAKAGRRKKARALLAMKVQYQKNNDPWKESITGAVGIGGLFIETPEPLEKGCQLKIRFSLPDSPAKIIETGGRVVWTRNQFEKILYFPGMGVEFTDISKEETLAIENIVRSINKARGIPEG